MARFAKSYLCSGISFYSMYFLCCVLSLYMNLMMVHIRSKDVNQQQNKRP